MAETVDLADILSIWPIAESFALQTSVGDLITLGRTSSSLRSSLHGQLLDLERLSRTTSLTNHRTLDPEVGKHQTANWTRLKAIAPFTCSSSTHTRGLKSRACVYCSKPICEACIVRDSFKHPNENTFKNRLRYYCKDCWSDGRPNRSFRYPALRVDKYGATIGKSNGSQFNYDATVEAFRYCECNLKDNGWLCLECKDTQNTAVSAPWRLITDPDSKTGEIQCYGHLCENIVDLQSTEKERRRVCLWCEKPVRRQLSGEDRYMWNMRTIEAHAIEAESRMRDLEEYNRKRSKILRMSRNEMRGTSEPSEHHNRPVFVRHLDTINYRNWMSEKCAPDPETVYQSKNGVWRYQPAFLYATQLRCKDTDWTKRNEIDVDRISRLTREGASAYARTNSEVHSDYYEDDLVLQLDLATRRFSVRSQLRVLKVRMLELHVTHGQDHRAIRDVLHDQYDVRVNALILKKQLRTWLEAPLPEASGSGSGSKGDSVGSGERLTRTDTEEAEEEEEKLLQLQLQQQRGRDPESSSVDTDLTLIGSDDAVTPLTPPPPPPPAQVAVNGHNVVEEEAPELSPQTSTTTAQQVQGTDDPPPYVP